MNLTIFAFHIHSLVLTLPADKRRGATEGVAYDPHGSYQASLSQLQLQ